MRKIYVCLISALFLFACNTNKEQEVESTDKPEVQKEADIKKEIPKAGSLTGDTLNISGKLVVFFGPVEKPAEKSQTDNGLAGFKESAAALIDSISSHNILGIYSSVGYFRVYTQTGGTMIISKSALNTEAGLLMSDGNQPPTIKKGILPAKVMHDQIKSYFFLK